MRGALVLAVVVVTACKGTAPSPPPVPSASASASGSASTGGSASASASAPVEVDGGPIANAEVDAAAEEAGEEGGTAVTTKDGSSIPPLAKGAAWSIVRWDMSRSEIEDAFRKAGTAVEAKTDAKTGAERVTARHGSWNGVVYFSA